MNLETTPIVEIVRAHLGIDPSILSDSLIPKIGVGLSDIYSCIDKDKVDATANWVSIYDIDDTTTYEDIFADILSDATLWWVQQYIEIIVQLMLDQQTNSWYITLLQDRRNELLWRLHVMLNTEVPL